MFLDQTPGLAPSISSLVVFQEPVEPGDGSKGKQAVFSQGSENIIRQTFTQGNNPSKGREIKLCLALKIILL